MDVDLVFDAEQLGGTAAVRTEDTRPVRIVDEQSSVVAVLEFDEFRQRGQIADHAVHPVDHDQLAGIVRTLLE